MSPTSSASEKSTLRLVEDALAILLMALVWLVPNHQLPWQSFHHELLMGLVLIFGCLLVGWQARWTLEISKPILVLLCCASIPWVQWYFGVLPLEGQALIACLYICAMAVAFSLGANSVNRGDRLFKLLAGALALAAVVNVPVQFVQWHQWYSSDVGSIWMILIPPLAPGHRPSGMIMQPNQLATIQVWGLIGISWLQYRRKISSWIFFAAFAVVGAGIGLTQSRAGLIELFLVAALLTSVTSRLGIMRIVMTWWAFIGLQILWAKNFEVVASWFNLPSGVGEARLMTLDSVRLDGWRAYVEAVLERPWFGYGLSDLGYAYTEVASEKPNIFVGVRFVNAHNILLDMLLWLGMPLAVLVIAVLSAFALKSIRALRVRGELVFPLAIMASFGVHAMLELPHYFLYFLAPVALCSGIVYASSSKDVISSLPRHFWFAPVAVGLVLVPAIWIDYVGYQDRYTDWRYEKARVGDPTGISINSPLLLTQLHDELRLYRLEFDESLDRSKLVWVNRVATGIASPEAFYIAAKANAYLGDLDRARDWMWRLNAILTPEEILVTKQFWREEQRQLLALSKIDWPDSSVESELERDGSVQESK